ncbi:MAG: hypothetical protein JRH11_07645 [Deltaproteobacteria bacterium]|nr:hypothetical protein [Deltaproteobacteria bacterium]
MIKTLALAALALALVACSSGPADEGIDTYRTGLTDSPSLETLDYAEWIGAAEGCEGHLDGSEVFGITQSDALVVASRTGAAVCVDTLEAISLELESLGALEAADELYSGFYAAIHLSQVQDWATPTNGTAISGTVDGGGAASGDPNPQPNNPGFMGPNEGDPNPQPNLPEDLEHNLGTPTPEPISPDVEANPTTTSATVDAPEAHTVALEGEELPSY